MKTNRTLIAMCIATMFASGSLCAKDKWEYHTDGWEKMKSYANVVIANDSVQKWGPWDEFVEPAAGAPSIAFIGAGAGDPYKIIPNPIPPNPEVGCADGAWCGYMAVQLMEKEYYSYRKHGRTYWDWRWERVGDVLPAEIALNFEPSAGSDPWGGYFDKGAVNLRLLTNLPEYGVSAGAETGMVPVEFNGLQGWFDPPRHFEGDISLEGGWNGLYYDPASHSWNKWKPVNQYATMGVLIAYVYGSNEEMARSSEGGDYDVTKVYAPFVAGQLTPLADMGSLNAGNVTAKYEGQTALAGGDVSMTVRFGSATWDGKFNGGSGATGFTVTNGSISGANFAASGSSIGAKDVGGCHPAYSGVSGTVNGSFYGPQAAAAGGIVDITKTATTYSKSITPVTTQYVDVFLANKTNQYVPKPANY